MRNHWGCRVASASVTSTTARPSGLFQGGANTILWGLIAGRAASAMRKIQLGMSLEQADIENLERISDLLQASADSIQFFDSGGEIGAPPSDSLAPQMDTAIEAATYYVSATEANQLADRLRELIDMIQDIMKHPNVDTATVLHPYFSGWSRLVIRETASVGEETRRM